jgi:hypothetical protein
MDNLLCEYPRCRRHATLVYLGRPLCDQHWEKESDEREEAWIREHLERRVDPALAVDGGQIVVSGDHLDVEQ